MARLTIPYWTAEVNNWSLFRPASPDRNVDMPRTLIGIDRAPAQLIFVTARNDRSAADIPRFQCQVAA
jgi:hypothetical protein